MADTSLGRSPVQPRNRDYRRQHCSHRLHHHHSAHTYRIEQYSACTVLPRLGRSCATKVALAPPNLLSVATCSLTALGHQRTFRPVSAMSALPPIADICSALAHPLCAKSGHQRTSSEAVLLVFRGPCCKPSNSQTMPGSPSLSHYMASMLGKCWWKIVTATTASAMGGGH